MMKSRLALLVVFIGVSVATSSAETDVSSRTLGKNKDKKRQERLDQRHKEKEEAAHAAAAGDDGADNTYENEPVKSFTEMSKDERQAMWYPLASDLLVCRYAPAVCTEKLKPRLLFSLSAGAKMYQDYAYLSFVSVLFALVGIFITSRWSPPGVPGTDGTIGTEAKAEPVINKGEYSTAKTSSFDPECPSSNEFVDHSELTSASPSFYGRISDSSSAYWSGTDFTFTNPAATFKLFVALLLVIELTNVMAPEQTILATPELVALYREKPRTHELVPHIVDWFMPSLSGNTADMWISRLRAARTLLLASWFSYMLLPSGRFVRTCGIAYAVGALCYVYLGSIGLMYNLAHSTQGGMLFVLGAIPAVPYLGCPQHGARAARWLRRFLFIGVLVPIYLFSGVSKFRYEGIVSNFTGKWLWGAFGSHKVYRSVVPSLYMLISNHKVAMMIFAWGNTVIEVILPLAVMLRMDNGYIRALFHFASISFHITIFLLMGPNFTRYCLMHLLASDPLGWFSHSGRSTNPSREYLGPTTWRDRLRAALGFFVLFNWFYVQYISDFDHLTGRTEPLDRHNPYFPFAELSMFAKPSTPNFYMAVAMVTVSLAALCHNIFSTKAGNEGFDQYNALPTNDPKKEQPESAKGLPLEERMDLAIKGPTLVFDGICNLCNGSMSWFQERCRPDSPVWYMWAQHQDTHELLEEVGISRQDILKSWAYVEDGVVYRGSTAWLMALRNLERPWCYLGAFGRLCPTFVREFIYNKVAANRYNVLGHSDSCQRPNAAMRAKFLHNMAVKGESDSTIPPSEKKRLLVVGCGPAGLYVTKKLAARFDVVVVEPKDYYEFTPGILRGMCDAETMKDLTFKLEPILCDDLSVTFIQGAITELTSRRATVKRVPYGINRRGSGGCRNDFIDDSDGESIDTMSLNFDYCVVAAGSEYTTSTLWKVPATLTDTEGELGTSYTLEGRISQLATERSALRQLSERRSGRVSIMGAGLVGVELAAEIKHHFPDIQRVDIFDPQSTILSTLPASVGRYATQWMESRGVGLITGDQFSDEVVSSAEQESDVVYRCVGVRVKADFLPEQVLDGRGQIRVNKALQIVRDNANLDPGTAGLKESLLFGAGRIFALGDCVAVEGANPPHAKQAYQAEAMAAVVVENLLRSYTVQCVQTRPGVLKELGPLMTMSLCSLGPEDCVFSVNSWVVAKGRVATTMKAFIQYTKMSDSRNELLGKTIWSLAPHW